MNKLLALGGVLLVCGIAGVGCQNTAEGAKEDTANNAAAVNEGAQKAAAATDKAVDNAANATKEAAAETGKAVSNGAENAGAALGITPKVKTAITADSELNNTANLINVNSTKDVVILKGHVMTNEMKQRASQIAEKTLKEANATQTVQNELTVTKH